MSLKRIKSALLVSVFALMLTLSSYSDGEALNSGKIYYGNDCGGKLVALTFDDGPHKFRTDEILDVLGKYNVKATFFVVGQMVDNFPDIVKRELAEGHEIGNHTYTHSKLRKLNDQALRREIEMTERSLYEVCEYRPKLFRPPEGWCSENIAKVAGELDYNIILWGIDTLDWAHNQPEKIYDCVMSNIRSGSIILFHDYVSGKSPTKEALEMIIPKLLADGYRFVTVSELISGDYS